MEVSDFFIADFFVLKKRETFSEVGKYDIILIRRKKREGVEFELMEEEIRIKKKFLKEELIKAPSLYVSIYLMRLADKQATSEDIAKDMGILESDVLLAFRYFEERKVFEDRKSVEREDLGQEKLVFVEEKQTQLLPLLQTKRPEYLPEEMQEYTLNETISSLLNMVQQKMGRPLRHHENSMIYGFYDWLGLPLDVIGVLLQYYVVSERMIGLRELEKMAIHWREKGIFTEDMAFEYVEYLEQQKKGYHRIMKALGRPFFYTISKKEISVIKTWTNEYQMSIELIEYACQKAIMTVNNPNMGYIDAMLKKWHDKDIHTIEAVELDDNQFQEEKKTKRESMEQGRNQSKEQREQNRKERLRNNNRFFNHEEREWDFEALERELYE